MESQVQVARLFDALSQSDRDMMDIRISLAGEKNYLDRILESDVLLVGPGLVGRSQEISHLAKNINPDIELILFVADEEYSAHAFREALNARARKVIPLSAPPMDLLQELVQIFEATKQKGKTKEGRLIVITQVKGGLGATSLAAALAEAASNEGRKTLLWDLDIESKDLSRALMVHEGHGSVISTWVNGTREISRDSLQDALVPLDSTASMLPPPDTMASGMDLLANLEGINIARKVTDLARVTYDCIIVDTCGRMSPLTGTLLRIADVILVLIDDSVLGMSAVPGFMDSIGQYLLSQSSIRFVCAGTKMDMRKIAVRVDPERRFEPECWELPAIPFDPMASSWPGTGKTLFSSGHRKMRQVINLIADRSGLLSAASLEKRAGLNSSILRFAGMLRQKGSLRQREAARAAQGR